MCGAVWNDLAKRWMRYLKTMKRFFFAAALMAALFLGGCADDLSPEVTDRPPAPYAPDPAANLPQAHDTTGHGY